MMEEEISSLMEEFGSIGLSVSVVREGGITYTKSFGYKNKECTENLKPTDLFRIASVSKTLVATAIMQLVERGKLSLDDDVNRYLKFKVQNPQYPDVPITIKMLLSHRSSINDSQGYYKTFNRINPQTNLQYAQCYSSYAPGEDYTYCNLNYNLLGAIIENVTGKRFDKFIRKCIIKPLRLHGSFNVLNLDADLFVNAYRYNREKNSFSLSKETYLPYRTELKHYTLGYSTPCLSPAGGMKITVEELARYMTMHMQFGLYGKKQIICKESEQQMREVQTQEQNYALSFRHYPKLLPDGKLIGQTGGAHGIHTAMIFHPEKQYGFVVFCNGCKSKSTDGHELNFSVIKSLYKNLIKN